MPESQLRRVVITGLGLISPLGNSPSAFWQALCERRSGVRPLRQVPTTTLPLTAGAEAIDFTGDIEQFGNLAGPQKRAIRKGLKVMCREIQMGVAASQLALQDAGLDPDAIVPDRTGVVFGSDYIMTMPAEFEAGVRGCVDENDAFQFPAWADRGLPKVTPLWLLKYLPNMPACHVAIYNDLRGPNNSITVREASANLALAEAYCTIQRGHADVMLGGATGSRVHPIRTIHIAMQEELAVENGQPAKACRPFDKHRTGMVLGEGAAALVLEEADSAAARGAAALAEVVGYGSAAVIERNSRARKDLALVGAMRHALRAANMTPEEVGHVHAHGISTVQGDRDEARAIDAVFGDRARPVPVVAGKSYFGNIGAGGGALELIASVMGMRAGHLFPTLNFETADEACPVSVVTASDVPAGASVMNVNVTPQGQASALIVRVAA